MNTPTQTSSRDLMASIRRVFSSRDSHMTLILILAIVVAAILVPRFSQPRTLTFLTLDVTATLLMAAGVPATVVIAIMGHTAITTSMGYQHADLDQARQALEAVAPRLGLTSTPTP